jgi:hypothetical protein
MTMLAIKPSTASEELQQLLEVFSQGDLAAAMGKPPETISRMTRSTKMRRSTERLIDDFWYAAHIAYQRFGEPESVRFFVLSRQPGLDGKTPAELIAAGQVEKVVDLIKHTRTREDTGMPAVKDSAKQRTKRSARLAGIASRKPSRLRDQLGMRHPVTAISEEREASYELQDQPAPPRAAPGRTTGIAYSEPAF